MALMDIFAKQTEMPLGSEERMINFMSSHWMLMIFNFLNVAYLLLIDGYVLGKLKNNTMAKWALTGCSLQFLSCVTSVVRYNINDEYGIFGIAGMLIGCMAFASMSTAVTPVFFLGQENENRWKIGGAVWFILCTLDFGVSLAYWEKVNFKYFQLIIPISVLYNSAAMGYCLYGIQKGSIRLDSAILPADGMEKLVKVLVAANVLALALGASNMPVFQYPQTGWTYTTTVVFVHFAGQIDRGYSSAPKGREGDALLAIA